MANIYTSLLGTAGHAPDQFGREIVMDMPNQSVMIPLVQAYQIEKGETLTAPLTSARSLTSITRGSGETNSISFTAISDTGKTFTKAAAYDAFELGYPTLNDIPADRLAAEVSALKQQSTWACANNVDAALLGLYSSASANVGGGGVDFSIDLLAEAIKALKSANAPGRLFAVLPNTQWDHLAQTDELVRFDVRGEGNTIVNGTGFRYHGVDIFTTGNVPTSGGVAHGLVFSEYGIRLAMRDMATVKEWEEPANLAGYRCLVYLDYAYFNSFTDWIVDFQTTDS